MVATAFAGTKSPPPQRVESRQSGGSAVDWLLGSLASVPLVILAVELIVDFVLLLVGILFAATIFFIFVTFVIWFVAIWLTIGLSVIAVAIACISLGAALIVIAPAPRQKIYTPGAMAGLVFSVSALALHALVIAAALYCHVALFT